MAALFQVVDAWTDSIFVLLELLPSHPQVHALRPRNLTRKIDSADPDDLKVRPTPRESLFFTNFFAILYILHYSLPSSPPPCFARCLLLNSPPQLPSTSLVISGSVN